MAVQLRNASNYVYQNLPTFRLDTPTNIAKKAAAVSLVAIALFSDEIVAFAEAGPLAYAGCMTICLGATMGGFIPACLVACAPTLAAPTP